jgi:hypothetical protein
MARWYPMTTNVKSVQVAARFVLRILILVTFAAFGNPDFGRSFAALLLLSVALCVVTGLMRHESLFARTLTHWDEAAAYGLLYALTTTITQAWL